MGMQRARPSIEILSGDSADVYFTRAERILEAEGRDPLVTMEVFTRQEAVLCGIDEAKNLLGHVLALVGVGVVLGLGGAALLTRLMESLLFGVTALDPATYVGVATVLIVTAALAGYLPARRATRGTTSLGP